MPDISLALVLLKKPMEAIGAIATGKTKEIITRLKADRNIKLVHQRLGAIQKVKTIWNVDRPLTISSFYYPASIKTASGESQKLTGLDDLPANHVVLEGTVGQGKSILLRWLLGREAKSGIRIPIFIELRRVPVGAFDEFVLRAFCDLIGASVAEGEIFKAFAAEAKISLLLDGFDEIDPQQVTAIATSVERLAQLYPQMRIIITARPESGIQNSPLFDVVPIANLLPRDLPDFFNKILSRDKELARRLTAAISTVATIHKLVSTPLLATLLTIVYRAHQKIPLDFSEFYEELFQILLIRHDKSKLGYERHRRTKLSDRQIEQIFEAFCYKTKALGKTSIERAKALEVVQQAISTSKIDCNDVSFIEDVKKVTCLLSEEGGRIEFLHQSVQEFFAARYIKSRPEGVAQKIYEQLGIDSRWQNWQQELTFLAQIDRYRASKYCFIPLISKTLVYLDSSEYPASEKYLKSKISDFMSVRQECVGPENKVLSNPRYFIQAAEKPICYMFGTFESRMFSLLFGSRAWRSAFDGVTHRQQLTYTQIAERCSLSDELSKLLTGTTNHLLAELRAHASSVKWSDESEEFSNL
jgi:NACHT domain